MTETEFTLEFAQLLDIAPDELNPETDLQSLDTWDSVGYLSAMVLIDERLGLTVRPDDLPEARTFGDILRIARPKLQQ